MKLSYSLAALLVISTLNAEELGQINVSTTGLGQEQSIEDVHASIQVIDKKFIKKTSSLSLPKIINEALGINVKDSGSTSSISIRGFNANHTLILVDGLRITGKYGSADLTSISLSNIERIEIVKGPMSALYGADAVSGVVNIITTKHVKHDYVNATILAGRTQNGQRDTYITKLNGAKKIGNISHKFSAELREKDQYRYDKSSVGTDLRNESRQFFNYGNTIKIDNNNMISTKLNFAHQNDDGVNYANYKTSEKEKRYQSSLLHNYITDNYLIDTNFGYGYSDTEVDRGSGIESTKYKQTELNTYFRHFTNDSTTNILGAGFKNEKIDVSMYTQKGKRTNYNLIYQNDYNFTNNFSSSVGVRYDNFSDFSNSTTPKASLIYKYNNFKFRASYGEAFKAPSFTNMYSHFTRSAGPITYDITGNHTLKPEESKTFEYAMGYAKNDFNFNISHHRTKLDNLIESYSKSFKFPINHTTYRNVAKSTINGTEISIDYNFTPNFIINLNWEYLNTKDKSTNERLVGSAKTTTKINLSYKISDFNFFLNVKKYNDYYGANNKRININTDYIITDLKINYNISDSIEWFIGVDNLQNKIMPYNMTSRGTPNDPGERYYYTGMNFAF